MPSPAASRPAEILPTLAAGQRVTVRSRRLNGTGVDTTGAYTVTRVAPASRVHHPAGWMVEVEGPSGGWACLVIVAATQKVQLLRGREQRHVVSVEVLADIARAS